MLGNFPCIKLTKRFLNESAEGRRMTIEIISQSISRKSGRDQTRNPGSAVRPNLLQSDTLSTALHGPI